MGFRPFGVVVDPSLMRGVREHKPQPSHELCCAARLDMTGIPQHAAARNSFTNAGNISCHGRSFGGQRTRSLKARVDMARYVFEVVFVHTGQRSGQDEHVDLVQG